jgi:hypothetical protein
MSSNKKILIGLIISIIIVISKFFIFDNTLELFENGYEWGEILSNLSLAYISSYIFYRIVVVEREKELKKNISKTINNTTKKMIFNGYYILDVLAENEKNERNQIHSKRHSIKREQYFEYCSLINPNSLSRFSNQIGDLELTNLTKIESIHLQCVEQMKTHINKVLMFLNYLDDDYLRILNEILDSQIISTDKGLFFAKTNTNFKVYQEMMYNYFLLIKQLENIYDKNKTIN